jgi:hypothetical protein
VHVGALLLLPDVFIDRHIRRGLHTSRVSLGRILLPHTNFGVVRDHHPVLQLIRDYHVLPLCGAGLTRMHRDLLVKVHHAHWEGIHMQLHLAPIS